MSLTRSTFLQNEQGYTLLETLVAMAIFVGIMLPTITMVGNFMFDRYPDTARAALAEGESEMNRVIARRDFIDAPRRIAGGLAVKRSVVQGGDIVDITITISTATEPARELLTLHKTVLTVQ